MIFAAAYLALRSEQPFPGGSLSLPGPRVRHARFSLPYEARLVVLFVGARLAATAIAVVLLAWQGDYGALEVAGAAYGLTSAALFGLVRRSRQSGAVWAADFAIASALIVASDDWRSPFYLLWLTTLALPAVTLTFSRAVLLAIAAPVVFLVIAVAGGPAAGRLGPVSSETLAIHLSLPFLLVCALAYAADALRRLQDERARRERLAIEAERRRIAWELHDSAKQRLHAAHLMISSLRGRVTGSLDTTVERAIVELESAASDMDTSLAELRAPLDGRPLQHALRDRATEMTEGQAVGVRVRGDAPALPPLVAAHAYRIGCEALTNALRHADATEITVTLETRDDRFVLTVRDDGRGIGYAPERPGASGLVAMENRAATIGARLSVVSPADGPGTTVVLDVPLAPDGAR
jgi:signal transduction histidine kinase